jgi:hypothetical protein
METVPTVVDDITYLRDNGRGNVTSDAEPSKKLGHVTFRFKREDIIA